MSEKSIFIQFKFKRLVIKGIILRFDMNWDFLFCIEISPVHIKTKYYSFDDQSFEFKLYEKLFEYNCVFMGNRCFSVNLSQILATIFFIIVGFA
jgi:hypothetical protein